MVSNQEPPSELIYSFLEAVDRHSHRASPLEAIRAEFRSALSDALIDMTILSLMQTQYVETYDLDWRTRGLRLTPLGTQMLGRTLRIAA